MATGADVVADNLVRHGITRVFAFAGGTIAPLLDALVQRNVEIIVGRHEQGSGYAALAAARLTNTPQVLIVSSGPGVTNAITPIADAYFDSVPLVVITGQVGTADKAPGILRQRGFQEVHTWRLLEPITKDCAYICKSAHIDQFMDRVFAEAVNGRPGSVAIDLPMNVQREQADAQSSWWVTNNEPPALGVGAARDIVCDLWRAKRPVIIAGHGVLLTDTQDALSDLAMTMMTPVSHSLLGLGALPSKHPLSLGFHGHTGDQVANRAIYESDYLLVLGSRLDVRQTGNLYDRFAPNAKIKWLDVNAAELCNTRINKVDRVHCDLKSALPALAAEAKKLNAELSANLDMVQDQDYLDGRAVWQQWINTWRYEYAHAPTKVYHALTMRETLAMLGGLLGSYPEYVVTTGVGQHQSWAARLIHFDYPTKALLTSGGHGAMGFDLPAAIGAAITRPNVPVICVVGDGSFQMNMQELATIVDYKLNIKIVVLDNQRLGLVGQFQALQGWQQTTCGNKWNPHFDMIAHQYGLDYAEAYEGFWLEHYLRDMIASPNASLIHVHTDPEEELSPMLLANHEGNDMWVAQ